MEPATDNPVKRISRGGTSVLAAIRVREALIFQTPALAAMALHIPDLSSPRLLQALLLSVGCFLIMAYIFAYNDWADLALDQEVPGKSGQTYLQRGIAPRQMPVLAASLAVVGTLVVALVSLPLLPIALLMVVLGLAYSLPVRGLKGKGIPIYSSALHFIGILLVYLFGAMAFTGFSPQAL